MIRTSSSSRLAPSSLFHWLVLTAVRKRGGSAISA